MYKVCNISNFNHNRLREQLFISASNMFQKADHPNTASDVFTDANGVWSKFKPMQYAAE